MPEKILPALPAPVQKLLKKTFGGSSSNVFRGMATLALGSGVARLIGIAAIPILTRLYSPEDYGVLAIFTAMISILAPLLTLRYVLAVPLPRHDGMAFNLLVLSTSLMLVMTLLISLLLWAFGERLLALFSMEVLTPWWWLISLGLLAAATYEMLTLWATRRRNYRVIARTRVWQSTTGSLVKIGLGLLALKPGGLLIGQVVAKGGGIGTLLRGFETEFRDNWRFLRWSRMRKAAWRHRGFPFFRVPSQFLLAISYQAPLLFMAVLYDAKTTGQFGLALMALGLPLQLFGRTLAKAFYAEAANLGNKQSAEVRRMAHAVLKRLALFSIPPAIVLFFFGPAFFTLAFGDEWRLAGIFASILAVYMVFQFIQTPVAYIFYLFDGQKKLLILNLQRAVLLLVCFGSAYLMNFTPEETTWIYALTLSAHYLLSTWYALRFIPSF
jgi:O-antigen/teichoic acid export membrane protein